MTRNHRVWTPRKPAAPNRAVQASPQAWRQGPALAHLLLAGAVLALCASAHAQSQPAAAPTVAAQSYEIPPGPLAQVLNRFAQEAGIYLTGASELTRNRTSPGLRGRYTPEAGLQALLAGTGLQASAVNGNSYALQPAPPATNQLPEVRVSERMLSPSALQPAHGYYAASALSASKTDQAIEETPHSISVVTAEQIDERKALSVEEAVAYTAGVRVGGSGLDPRFDQISIRGYAATSNADFLDGLRQPNSGWLSYFTSEPYMLERIEILKGPASVLYGQISPGGMVNRVSKRPSADAAQEVQLQYGSHNHVQGQFDVGGQLDAAGDLRYRLVGLARDAQTDIQQIDNDNKLLAPSLLWRIAPQTKLTLLGQFQDRLTAGSPRPWQNGTTLTDFWAGDEDFDKLDQRQWTLGYEFEHAFNDTFTLQHHLRYGEVDTVNQYLSAGSLSGSTLSRSSTAIDEKMTDLSTDTRLVTRVRTGALEHQLLLGLDWSRMTTDVVYATGRAPSIDINQPNYSQHVDTPSTVVSDLDGRTRRQGWYLQDQIEWGHWRFSGGLRHDSVDGRSLNRQRNTTSRTHNSKTTAQAGALYRFDSGLAPYASYTQSFLPTSGTDVYGNSYDPTEGEQYELGLKFQPSGSRSLYTVSLYQLTQSNVLTRDPNNQLNRIQTGEQRSRGLELEAITELSASLKLTASYSYNRAKITRNNDGNQGKTPTNTPRHLASLWMNYKLPPSWLDGASVGGGMRYEGSSFDNAANTRRNASHTLFDLALGYDLPGTQHRARVELNAKNLSDKRYIVCEAGYCYRGEGRSLLATLRYGW